MGQISTRWEKSSLILKSPGFVLFAASLPTLAPNMIYHCLSATLILNNLFIVASSFIINIIICHGGCFFHCCRFLNFVCKLVRYYLFVNVYIYMYLYTHVSQVDQIDLIHTIYTTASKWLSSPTHRRNPIHRIHFFHKLYIEWLLYETS